MSRKGSDVAKDAEATLIACFQNGLNVTQACLQAGISTETFYTKCEKDSKYSDKMQKAQQFVNMKARKNIVDVVDGGNIEQSRWWLERRDPEFKPKSDVTSGDKPVPILGGFNVHMDDSPAPDSGPEEANPGDSGGDISGQDSSDTPLPDPIRTDQANIG